MSVCSIASLDLRVPIVNVVLLGAVCIDASVVGKSCAIVNHRVRRIQPAENCKQKGPNRRPGRKREQDQVIQTFC